MLELYQSYKFNVLSIFSKVLFYIDVDVKESALRP